MKHQKKFRVVAAVVAVSVSLGVTAFAASYDSSEDPLISLSYLTKIFRPEIENSFSEKTAGLESTAVALTGEISSLQNEISSLKNAVSSLESDNSSLESRLAELEKPSVDPDHTADTTSPGVDTEPPTTTPELIVSEHSSTLFEVVELTWGDSIYAVTACEIQLRAGSALCIAPDSSQGLANITTGAELYNGQPLEKNHLLLIPRGDGRGVMANSESVFLMVRGEYKIVKEQ